MASAAFIINLICFWIHVSRGQRQDDVADTDKGCPLGAYRLGEFCYYVSPVPVIYHNAELLCEAGGGIVAPIKDNQTHHFIQKLIIRKVLHRYWIGINDLNAEGAWMYSDGTPVQQWNMWHPGEPNNFINQDCACMWSDKNYEWDDMHCAFKLLFICQFQGAEACANKDSRHTFGDQCFYFSQTLASYYAANATCHELGGILAAPKNQATHDYLRKTAYNDRFWLDTHAVDVEDLFRKANSYKWSFNTWIGVTYVPQWNQWAFSDGDLLALYAPWAPRQPIIRDPSNSCVHLTDIHWSVSSTCNNHALFVCRYKVENDASGIGLSDSALKPQDDDRKCGTNRIRIGIFDFILAVICSFVVGALVTTVVHMVVRKYKKKRTCQLSHMRLEEEVQLPPNSPEAILYNKNDRTVSFNENS